MFSVINDKIIRKDYNYLTQYNENISYLELDLFPLFNDIVFLPDILMIFAKEHFNNGNE